MLIIGERIVTYLTHVSILPRSVESLERTDKKTGTTSTAEESHGAGWKLRFFVCFFLDFLGSAEIFRHESGRFRSFLPFLTIFFFFVSSPSSFYFKFKQNQLLLFPDWENVLTYGFTAEIFINHKICWKISISNFIFHD